jgi:hypothetical protein
MLTSKKPTQKKKVLRKGSQPKQTVADDSSSSSDSDASSKKNQKLLGQEVKHQALINMKTEKNKDIYEQATNKYLNSVPPTIGGLQNSHKYMETKRALGNGPTP